MPYVGQQSPSGNYIFNGSKWEVPSWVGGVDPVQADVNARAEIAASGRADLYASNTPPPWGVVTPQPYGPAVDNGTAQVSPASPAVSATPTQAPVSATPVLTSGSTNGPIIDRPGRSVGGQIIDEINARIKSGQPLDQAWSENLWRRTGITPAQAASFHQFGANFSIKYGRPMSSNEIDEALGQVKVQGLQIPDEKAWKSPPVPGQPAVGAQPGSTVETPGATTPGATTPGTTTPGATTTTPGAAATTTPPMAATSGVDISNNPFLKGLRMADLLDTARRDNGDLSNVAQTIIGNAEANQGGGRYNPANRDMYAQAADDLKGLFALDSVKDNSFTNTPERLAGYLNTRTTSGGTDYDTSQLGRLGDALAALEANPTSATNTAFLSDPTAQTLAARTALQRSVNPLLARTVGTRVNELASRYNTVDTSRAPDKGGFIRFLKNSGIF